ncbi:hypothetical protein Vadar_012448 [Vaccinium darrowii]|uniref:Uncharacterized protein n=1 Tax=Vaccinium darrowii TaxID=229202 RepID=A0ACB7Y6A2_9ERIC|nr:hypothetical protein Vadar_012448 [Vaccinium darrowii]
MPISVLVYVCGQVLQQINGGPSYSGGTTLHLTMERGITLYQLQVLISNAAGMASTHMTITFRYLSVRFPNLAYEYVGIELVDNNGVDLIFDVDGEVPSYVPVLFTEAITSQRQQPYHIVEQHHPGDHYPGESSHQQCYEHDTSLLANHPFQLQSKDESDTSSFEDVDAGLDTEELEGDDFEQHGSESEDFEAILNKANIVPMHQPPCPMYTQDTWSNIFYPSPPLWTRTQVGWDGRSDFFVGQEALSKVLVPYYPAAGRLTMDSDGRLVVHCTDEGAVFVEAKADCTIEDIGNDTVAMERLVYDTPSAKHLIEVPPLAAQLESLTKPVV